MNKLRNAACYSHISETEIHCVWRTVRYSQYFKNIMMIDVMTVSPPASNIAHSISFSQKFLFYTIPGGEPLHSTRSLGKSPVRIATAMASAMAMAMATIQQE